MNDNKLIAEFMGLEYAPKDKRWDDWFDKDDNRITFGNRIPLQYHSSWDWLMPVIQKCYILNDEYGFEPFKDFCDLDIRIAYDEVVGFIKEKQNA